MAADIAMKKLSRSAADVLMESLSWCFDEIHSFVAADVREASFRFQAQSTGYDL
jgi:hypothetical protein